MNPIKLILGLIVFIYLATGSLRAQNLLEDSEKLGSLLAQKDTLIPKIEFSSGNISLFYEGSEVDISNKSLFVFKKRGQYVCKIKDPKKSTSFICGKDTLKYNWFNKIEINFNGRTTTVRPIKEYAANRLKDSLVYFQNGQLQIRLVSLLKLPYSVDHVDSIKKPADTIHPDLMLVVTTNKALHLLGKTKTYLVNRALFKLIAPYITDPNTQTIDPFKLREFKKNPYLTGLEDWLDDESYLQDLFAELAASKSTSTASEMLDQKLKSIEAAQSAIIKAPEKEILEDAATEMKKATENVYSSAPSLSTFDQTAILKGLAAFIEKRAQEELNVLFLDRLKKNLEQSDLGKLFPNSKDQFTRLELSNYKSTLEQALPALIKDMEQIGLNFSELILSKNELRGNIAVYNTAFLVGLIQQSLRGADLDSLLVYTYDYNQRRVSKIRQQQETKQVELLAKFNDTKRRKLLDSIGIIFKLNADLTAECLESLKNLNTFYSPELKFTPQTDPDGSLKTRTDSWRLKLGNAIGSIEGIASDYDELKSRLKYLQWGYFNNFDESASYRINQYDELFGVTKPDTLTLNKELLTLMKISKDSSGLQRIKKVMDVQEQIAIHLEEIYQKKQANQIETLQNVLNTYQQYWMIKKGLELEKAKWPVTDTSSNQDFSVLRFFIKVLDHEDVLGFTVNEIEQSFFKKTTPFVASDQVVEEAQKLQKINAALLEKLRPHWEEWKTPKNTNIYPEIPSSYLEHFKKLENQYKEKDVMIKNGAAESRIEIFVKNEITPLINNIRTDVSSNAPALKVNPFLLRVFTSTVEVNAKIKAIHSTLDDLQKQWQQKDAARQEFSALKNISYTSEEAVAINNATQFMGLAQLGMDLLRAFIINKVDTLLVPRQKAITSTVSSAENTSNSNVRSLIQKDSVVVMDKKIAHTRKWMSREEFHNLMMNQHTRPIFLGLVYHQLRVNTKLGIEKYAPEVLADQIISIVHHLNELQIARQQKRSANIPLGFRDYLPLTQSGIQLIKSILDVPAESSTLGKKWKVEGVVKIFDEGIALYEHLDQKKYFYALGNVLALYDQFFPKPGSDQVLLKKSKQDSTSKKFISFRQSVIKYGNFLAQTASAKDKDDVKNLLQEYAAPQGSSQVKRLNDQNLSFNAYLGASAVVGDKVSLSLSTPVGLAYNFRVGNNGHGYRTSLSLFTSILDVGPIVSYDFSNKQTGNLDDLKFSDFLAPGIFAFYNVNRSPFTVAFGWQGYRTIGNQDRTLKSRVGLSFLIDVPIFNLFTSKSPINTTKSAKQ